jgi:hypothetical protein
MKLYQDNTREAFNPTYPSRIPFSKKNLLRKVTKKEIKESNK